MTIAELGASSPSSASDSDQDDAPVKKYFPLSSLSYGMQMTFPTNLYVDWRPPKEQLKAASNSRKNETSDWSSEHFSVYGMLWKICVCSYIVQQGGKDIRLHVACLDCDNPRKDLALECRLEICYFDEAANAWEQYDNTKPLSSDHHNYALLPYYPDYPKSWKVHHIVELPFDDMMKAKDLFIGAIFKINVEEIVVDVSLPILLSANIINACAKRMYERPELADVTIIANDGTRFDCHRFAIAITSPVFLTMMTCGMKESITNEISLPTTSPAVIAAFRKLAYGLDAEIDYNDLNDLVEFGHQYDVEVVRHALLKLLSQFNRVSASQFGHCLPKLLQPHVLEFLDVDYEDECVQTALLCAMNSLTMWSFDPWFLELDADEFIALMDALSEYSSKLLRCAHRDIDPWMWFRFEFARCWIYEDEDRQDENVGALMESIDFTKMTVPQLLYASEVKRIQNDSGTLLRIMRAFSGCH